MVSNSISPSCLGLLGLKVALPVSMWMRVSTCSSSSRSSWTRVRTVRSLIPQWPANAWEGTYSLSDRPSSKSANLASSIAYH